MSQFDYNRVIYRIMTWKKAATLGLQPGRKYGYYVYANSVLPGRKTNLVSWCKTKAIAEDCVKRYERYQIQGLNSCPCGSGKQRRTCCMANPNPQVVYDEARFRKLITLDMFLQFVAAKHPNELEVLFNSYVRGDSAMECLYNERCAS